MKRKGAQHDALNIPEFLTYVHIRGFPIINLSFFETKSFSSVRLITRQPDDEQLITSTGTFFSSRLFPTVTWFIGENDYGKKKLFWGVLGEGVSYSKFSRGSEVIGMDTKALLASLQFQMKSINYFLTKREIIYWRKNPSQILVLCLAGVSHCYRGEGEEAEAVVEERFLDLLAWIFGGGHKVGGKERKKVENINSVLLPFLRAKRRLQQQQVHKQENK